MPHAVNRPERSQVRQIQAFCTDMSNVARVRIDMHRIVCGLVVNRYCLGSLALFKFIQLTLVECHFHTGNNHAIINTVNLDKIVRHVAASIPLRPHSQIPSNFIHIQHPTYHITLHPRDTCARHLTQGYHLQRTTPNPTLPCPLPTPSTKKTQPLATQNTYVPPSPATTCTTPHSYPHSPILPHPSIHPSIHPVPSAFADRPERLP